MENTYGDGSLGRWNWWCQTCHYLFFI